MRNNKKWLIIVEAIVLYIALLNVISHVRGPIPYSADTQSSLAQIEEFEPMFDMDSVVEKEKLPFQNTTEGAVVGYAAWLSLKDLNQVQVSFVVDCPSKCVGQTLVIDLYNLEEGYDSDEQETRIILEAGLNKINVQLAPGETHPPKAQLRIFTTNAASYSIEELSVNKLVPLERVTPIMVIVPVFLALVLCGTIVFQIKRNKTYGT